MQAIGIFLHILKMTFEDINDEMQNRKLLLSNDEVADNILPDTERICEEDILHKFHEILFYVCVLYIPFPFLLLALLKPNK